MTPRATYRFQFHRDFTFADAEALVSYLADLGISHVYASPVTVAVPGSTHGYDVADPTRINPELGGEETFRSLAASVRARGMGIVIDIVPNHMGVAGGANPWWTDVLKHGRESRYARFFDIDWHQPILLPLLGTPLPQALADGVIGVDRSGDEPVLTLYGDQRLPLSPGTGDLDLPAMLDAQHYRLGWWRSANDSLNWRRFFTISELAGLRTEDETVFEESHSLYFRLYAEGLIDGLRIDHVDGLTDPAGYCRRLRQRMDGIARPEGVPPGPAWIVVEKILGAGEPLADNWGIDGTSGYDFMEQVSALLHDPEGEAPLTALWHDVSGRALDFEAEELAARQDMLRWAFEGQLGGCVEAFTALAASDAATEGLTAGMLRRAIERMLWVFPVYRTYGTGSAAPAGDAAIREEVRRRAARFTPPGEAMVVDTILDWLAGTGPGDPARAADAVRRFQQLSAPIAAKAVEDTAFYRYGRLLSRTDVGFDANRFSMPVPAFHAISEDHARNWPGAMLTTATHDHKRGEDVRARLAVLSEVPDEWRACVTEWDRLAQRIAPEVDPADRYALYQTLYGAWPGDLRADDAAGLSAFAERVIAWQEKALREAKLRSSWEEPDEAYEGRAARLVRALLDSGTGGAFLADMQRFLAWTAAPALANMLAQVALRCTVPGVPDCYQGCELADFSLVDPDNRRPVDYALRQTMLAGDMTTAEGSPDAAKFALLRHLLDLRRTHPDLFAHGSYEPIAVEGPRAGHAIAFRRRAGAEELLCIVAIRTAGALAGSNGLAIAPEWWGDTRLADGSPVAALLEGTTLALAIGCQPSTSATGT